MSTCGSRVEVREEPQVLGWRRGKLGVGRPWEAFPQSAYRVAYWVGPSAASNARVWEDLIRADHTSAFQDGYLGASLDWMLLELWRRRSRSARRRGSQAKGWGVNLRRTATIAGRRGRIRTSTDHCGWQPTPVSSAVPNPSVEKKERRSKS